MDNGSRDGSVEFLREKFPAVRVVPLDRNYGFSIGNNLGAAEVRSDIVVLLNNDMAVDEGFLVLFSGPFQIRTSQPSLARNGKVSCFLQRLPKRLSPGT